MVKRKIFTFFLLLAGLCYLSSVLELDEDEDKANFKLEQQIKIGVEKTADNHNVVPVPATAIVIYVFVFLCLVCIKKTNPRGLRHLFIFLPPERLFLKNSVFRI